MVCTKFLFDLTDCFYFLCVFPVPSLCQEIARGGGGGGKEIAGTLLKELQFLVQRDIGTR